LISSDLDQIYSRLNASRYRYESAGGKFVTELEVDSNGFVTEYPGFFENCVGTLSGICCRWSQDSRREHVVPYRERVVTKAFGHVELAFDDLLDQLHAGDDPPGIEETLEPKHRSHPRLDAPVFLLHDVVQVGARADLDLAFENGS
jgi:hypothetical protein